MNAILRVMRQELAAIFGDVQILSLMVLSLVVYALIYPFPYRPELLREVPVAVVDLDGSGASRQLVREIDASEAVAITARPPSMSEAERLVHQRRAYGIVLVPEGFERDLLRGRQSPIAVYADASYFLMYQKVLFGVMGPARATGVQVQVARQMATGISRTEALSGASPINLVEVPLFNPAGGYATYILPAAFVLIVQQTMMMGLGLVATRRPPSREPLPWRVLGRAAAWLGLYALLLPMYLVVLPWAYGLPWLGDLPTLAALAVPFVLATGFLAQAVAATLRRAELVQMFLLAVGMPLFFLSGFAWPMEALPPALRAAGQVVPSTAMIDGYVRMAQMGARTADLVPVIRQLWALAFVYALITLLLRGTTADAARPPGRGHPES